MGADAGGTFSFFVGELEVWEELHANFTLQMQAAGSPPEELISNPLMEDLGSLGGLGGAAAGGAGGVPDCPQQ